ncbi:MAG: hypothetical protein SVR94_16860 [Pseudomonadota bacterium]|nr:hypothetical protein [Pseudomonadota bacterium]
MIEATTARAWFLDFGQGFRAAVGLHEMSQVLLSVTLFKLPCTPQYCQEVFIFQNRILPVLDIVSLFHGGAINRSAANIIGVALYQAQPHQPVHYGGFYLEVMPSNIVVSDDQAAHLPDEKHYWRPFTASCFTHEGEAIPILNLAAFFTQQLSDRGIYI